MIDEAALQAIIEGDVERLRERLDAGIDPMARDRDRGYTLLHVAAQESALEASEALLAAGADANATDGYGNGPLWTAVYNDSEGHVVEILLEAGADPMHANKAGATPVSLARTIGGATEERLSGYARDTSGTRMAGEQAGIGVSDVQPNTGGMRHHEEAQRLWQTYVPARGQASTVQGELIRAVEKLRDEARRNGNLNWCDDHAILVAYVRDTLLGSGLFGADARREINRDTQRLLEFEHPETSDEPYDRLTDRVVEWARAHPEPVTHESNPQLLI